jgi:hypothetical protein
MERRFVLEVASGRRKQYASNGVGISGRLVDYADNVDTECALCLTEHQHGLELVLMYSIPQMV